MFTRLRLGQCVTLAAIVPVILWNPVSGEDDAKVFDLVVYGGTPAGIVTAVAGAREGLRVAIIEPQKHLGGAITGGIGRTDHGRKAVIGGYSVEFFELVGKRYGEPITWYFEPRVAEDVFTVMLREANVQVFKQHRLRERTGVQKSGTTLQSLKLENDMTFTARVFADASYEGDLMAQSGASYTWGREGIDEYDESLAGVRERTPKHQFVVPVNAFDALGRLLPEISAAPRGQIGSADRKVQAYNFRVCTTTRVENRVPFPKPRGYSESRYEVLARMLTAIDNVKPATSVEDAKTLTIGMDAMYRMKHPWSIYDVLQPRDIKNGKNDTNNEGAFSTDYIGGSYDYPDGNYKTRARVWQAHVEYVQGYLYFLANSARVPRRLHDVVAPWGLCKDEFVDNDNWPYQLYIREGRRLRGEYVMSQRDIQTELTKPDSIGMGSYNSDSHNVQRIARADGSAENEGDMQVPVKPYEIPYRVMLPKRTEVTNLLVPVAFSATHVAYSSIRMEPQYMILGHAAGVAAKMAIDGKTALQEIDVPALRARLLSQRAVLALPSEGQAPPHDGRR